MLNWRALPASDRKPYLDVVIFEGDVDPLIVDFNISGHPSYAIIDSLGLTVEFDVNGESGSNETYVVAQVFAARAVALLKPGMTRDELRAIPSMDQL